MGSSGLNAFLNASFRIKRPQQHRLSLHLDIDWCTESGANKLAAMIRAYWLKKGIPIDVWVERMPSAAARHGTDSVFQIRSNVVNRFDR